MWFFETQRNVKLSGAFAALLLCSACGGASGSTSSTTPPASVNQAPSVTISAKSIITEGQPFDLDASQSTDRDGDSLSYSWRQVSGPSLEISNSTASTLSLTAPMLEADEAVSFEVSVSDGALTTSSTVSLSFEDLKIEPILSEATQYGTGGPQSPSVTVADPSIYEGNRPLDRLIGLTSVDGAGYSVHWTESGAGHDMPVSSQAFFSDGEKNGSQVDGVFLGGDQGTFERNGNIYNRFNFGITFATVQSGDTVYNFNGLLEFAENFTIGYRSYRGPVEGEVDGFGDELIAQEPYSERTMGGAYAPIGQGNVLLTLSERTTEDFEDDAAIVEMTSYVVDSFGNAIMHNLGSYVSNGTSDNQNWMTATAYGADSYLAAWSQNTVENGYDIQMQRATETGILLGEQTTVNSDTGGDQLYPISTTMTDGNILILWASDPSGGAEMDMRARLVGPDGAFLSDEITLPAGLAAFDEDEFRNQEFFTSTALNTNEVLVTWRDETSGATEIRAFVIDSNLDVVSNEFLIAAGDEADDFEGVKSLVLADNRVILGWFNNYPYDDERPETSHTVGFYPVGKE